MVKFTLFLVRLFRNPIEWLGVDFPQFEVLLGTKLTLDFRRGSSDLQTSGRKKRSFLSQLFIYITFGLFLGYLSFSIGDIMMSLTILFSIIMVSLSITLISEFTSVLFDPRDNYILLPRPITPRTLLLLRLTHIQFYIGYIALALSIASGIIVAVKYNALTVLIYFVTVGLCTWITLILTTLFYMLISKMVNAERFKDIITYVQIFLAVIIFGGYQLLPRLIDETVLKQASMTVHWWTYIFPPAWFAAFVKLSLFTEPTSSVLVLSSLALIIPVTGVVFLIRFLSKGFENILGEGSSEKAATSTMQTKKNRKINKIKKLFCISDLETAGWDFAVATTRRDRKFKQSVYPSFGMMLIFVVIILKPDLNNLADSFHKMGDSSRYLLLIFMGFMGNQAISQLPYSDTPEASWIYKALPFKLQGHLFSGAIKAMLVRFFLPVYLLVTIPAFLIWGIDIFPQICLGGLGIVFIQLVIIKLQKMDLPFTRKREMQEKGGTFITQIFTLIPIGLLAGMTYLTTFIPGWITFLICGLVAGLIVLSFRILRNKYYLKI